MLGFMASASTSCYDDLVPPAVAIEIVLPLGKDGAHLNSFFKWVVYLRVPVCSS